MSRSTKKPYVDIACSGRGSIKKWKKQCNKKIRNTDIEISSGRFYKKLVNSFTCPNDGKQYRDNAKATRK